MSLPSTLSLPVTDSAGQHLFMELHLIRRHNQQPDMHYYEGNGYTCFLKILHTDCPNAETMEDYARCYKDFRLEYEHMRRLEELMTAKGADYTAYFPRYYHYGYIPEYGNAPYICMEYLKGNSLEQYLQQTPADSMPRERLHPGALYEICRQTAEALKWLCKGNMLYYDLRPAHLFLQPTDSPAGIRLRLVDFTSCDYYNPTYYNRRLRYADGYAPHNTPSSLLLYYRYTAFVSSLFFQNYEDYRQQHTRHRDRLLSYFLDKFDHLPFPNFLENPWADHQPWICAAHESVLEQPTILEQVRRVEAAGDYAYFVTAWSEVLLHYLSSNKY